MNRMLFTSLSIVFLTSCTDSSPLGFDGESLLLEDSEQFPTGLPIAMMRVGVNYAVVVRDRMHEIGLFDPEGRLLRTVGRFGEGPEEFQMIFSLAGDRESNLLVFDPANARETILSPELDHLGSRRLPQPRSSRSVLTDTQGRRVFLGPSPGSDERRMWTVVDSVGTVLLTGPVMAPDAKSTWTGGIDESTGELCISELYSAEIQCFSLDSGRRVAVFNIAHEVFVDPPSPPTVERPAASEPVPTVISVRPSPDGTVWVLLRVADVGWAEAARGDHGRTYDSVVIQLDRNGQVLREDTLDDYALIWLGEREFASFALTEIGEPVLRINRLAETSTTEAEGGQR